MDAKIRDREELHDDPFEVTGSIEDLALRFLEQSESSARAYLRESWIADAMATLFRARCAAGLTQKELAQRMGTTQSSIARLEHADDTTLGRFWDYLAECGAAPAKIESVPLSGLMRFARHRPASDQTAIAVRQWLFEEELRELHATPSNATKATLASFLASTLASAIVASAQGIEAVLANVVTGYSAASAAGLTAKTSGAQGKPLTVQEASRVLDEASQVAAAAFATAQGTTASNAMTDAVCDQQLVAA